jgi:hypothetical protein
MHCFLKVQLNKILDGHQKKLSDFSVIPAKLFFDFYVTFHTDSVPRCA